MSAASETNTTNLAKEAADRARAAAALARHGTGNTPQGTVAGNKQIGALAQADIATIREFLNRTSGIQVEASQAYLVVSRLSPVATRLGFEDVGALVASLRLDPPNEVKAAVIDAMTTNETSFFRNEHPFEAISSHVIPRLLENRAPNETLTIWCAACSSGQEVYSLAISLCENHPDLVKRRRVRLLASDLSPRMVRRTRAGRYSQFEVTRGLDVNLLDRYFTQRERDWAVKEPLMRMVETRQLNLLEPWTMVPPCDLVLMRNVLIYFAPETKSMLLARLLDTVLRPDGFLVLGASETVTGRDPGFEAIREGKTVLYRPATQLES